MNLQNLTFPAPLTYNDLWEVVDSSKLSTFMSCERRYFYEYLLGWRTDNPKQDLIYGIAWHIAKEHLFANLKKHGYSAQILTEAYQLFYTEYRKTFDESSDDKFAPKNPANAYLALCQYGIKYQSDQQQLEVLYTEVAGSVPISETDNINFMIDVIVRDQDGIAAWDHKTTKRETKAWADSFTLAVQTGTYSHVLYILYDVEEVFGMKIDGTVFRNPPTKKSKKAKGNEHRRINISRNKQQQLVWLWQTQYHIGMLKWNMEQFTACKEEDDILTAFPMRTTACAQWYTCPYHTFCQAWDNPLQRCAEVQPGFKIEHWDPREREKTASFVFNGKTIEARTKEEKEDEKRA